MADKKPSPVLPATNITLLFEWDPHDGTYGKLNLTPPKGITNNQMSLFNDIRNLLQTGIDVLAAPPN